MRDYVVESGETAKVSKQQRRFNNTSFIHQTQVEADRSSQTSGRNQLATILMYDARLYEGFKQWQERKDKILEV